MRQHSLDSALSQQGSKVKIRIEQTQHLIGDFEGIFKHLKNVLHDLENAKEPHLVLFPELFLSGYPLQDLCLQTPFINAYLELLNNIEQCWQKQKYSQQHLLLMGGLEYELSDQQIPKKIYNSIFKLSTNEKVQFIYQKRLLPNYDIFDEKKYFTPGDKTVVINWNDKKIGLQICEDMWPSMTHPVDPTLELQKHCIENNLQLDLLVNLSASPFTLEKQKKRLQRGQEISRALSAPMAYINRVGGEDEILFDGSSFIINDDNILFQAPPFKAHSQTISLNVEKKAVIKKVSPSDSNIWEQLFHPQIQKGNLQHPELKNLTDEECQLAIDAIIFGIQEYAKKCQFSKFLVALSGGIDSSLVLTLVKLGLKSDQQVEAIYMPGLFSASISYDLSLQLCKNLGVPLRCLPIKFIHSTCRNLFKDTFGESLSGLADENIQSRMRGNFIYARSNQTQAMVLNTSNKSEIAVGYSTLYGDSVGAISPLGDLYKTEVFQLSRYINKINNKLIPEQIIDRAPSAELRENQTDQQSLPAYHQLDAMLELLLSYRAGSSELIKNGFPEAEVQKVIKLVSLSEYKRKQFCPIIKLKQKSFGFGYRIPICKDNKFYQY